ncbi:unnamed protein product [Closterium sp. NIES-64]|nr:unnamed protein product [Closterium sp. NIES-64]
MSHSCVLIPPAACDDSTAALAAPLLPTASRAGGKECSGAEPASAAAGGGGGGHGEKRGLKRSLNVVDGVCMVLGVVVGSGIFATPGLLLLLESAGSPTPIMVLGVVVGSGIFATPGVVLLDSGGAPISALIVWLCAGIVAYSCCEVYAELGSSIPHAGGDGEYIQLAFGDLLSFVFMWMFFFVSTGGGIAILIVTFARYTIALGASEGASEEQMEMGVRIIGCSFTLLLTAINCAGTRCSHQLYHPLPLLRAGEPLSSPSLNHRLLLHSPPHGHQLRWYVLYCPTAPTTCACSHPPDHPLLYHSSIPCPNHRLLLPAPPHRHQLCWYVPALSSGVKAGALVQNILTVTKALLIAAVVACAPIFISLHGTSVAATNFSQPLPPLSGYNWSRAGAGLVAAVWAFDGWNCLGYLSEELKNPKRDLPRSLSFGMLTAVGISVRKSEVVAVEAVNVVFGTPSGHSSSPSCPYSLVSIPLPIDPTLAVGKSEVVAVEAVEAVFGPHSGRFIAFLVALNVLGAANATLLCHARFFYAKARDGQLFSFLSAVTSGGAPYASLLATGGWIAVVVFVAANHLEKLIDYFGIAAWMFYGLVGASLIKLRWDLPDLPRPYKASLYPLPGVIVVVVSTYLVISSLVTQLIPSLLSLAFVFTALPVYFAIHCMKSAPCCAASCAKTPTTINVVPEIDIRRPLLS